MSEMTQVWERLFIGSRMDAELLSKSNPHRITSVITLCEEEVLYRDSAVNYLHLPISESNPIDIGSFDAILDGIAENIRWGTVLVHCGSGWSRAPVMTAAWMHAVGYKDLDLALEEIAALRPVIAPSRHLISSVRKHLR